MHALWGIRVALCGIFMQGIICGMSPSEAVQGDELVCVSDADSQAITHLHASLACITHQERSCACTKEDMLDAVGTSVECVKYMQRRFYPKDNPLVAHVLPRALHAVQDTLDCCRQKLEDLLQLTRQATYDERVQVHVCDTLYSVEDSLQELFATCAQSDEQPSLRVLAHEQEKNRQVGAVYPEQKIFMSHDSCVLLAADLVHAYCARFGHALCPSCTGCPAHMWCAACCRDRAAAAAETPEWLKSFNTLCAHMEPKDQLAYLNVRIGTASALLDKKLQDEFTKIREAEAGASDGVRDQEQSVSEGVQTPTLALVPVSPTLPGLLLAFNDDCDRREKSSCLRGDGAAVHSAESRASACSTVTRESLQVACERDARLIDAHQSLITAQALAYAALIKKNASATLVNGLPEDLAGALSAILETSPGKVRFAESVLETEEKGAGLSWLCAWVAHHALIGQSKKQAVLEAKKELPEDVKLAEVVGQVHAFIDTHGLRVLVPTLNALLVQYNTSINAALAKVVQSMNTGTDACERLRFLLEQPNRERVLGGQFSEYMRALGHCWWPQASIITMPAAATSSKAQPAARRMKKKAQSKVVLEPGAVSEESGLALFARALTQYNRLTHQDLAPIVTSGTI